MDARHMRALLLVGTVASRVAVCLTGYISFPEPRYYDRVCASIGNLQRKSGCTRFVATCFNFKAGLLAESQCATHFCSDLPSPLQNGERVPLHSAGAGSCAGPPRPCSPRSASTCSGRSRRRTRSTCPRPATAAGRTSGGVNFHDSSSNWEQKTRLQHLLSIRDPFVCGEVQRV